MLILKGLIRMVHKFGQITTYSFVSEAPTCRYVISMFPRGARNEPGRSSSSLLQSEREELVTKLIEIMCEFFRPVA